MKNTTEIGIGILFIILFVGAIVMVEKKGVNFCKERGYENFIQLKSINNTVYIKCCSEIATKEDFKEKCEIFEYINEEV